MNVKKVLFFLLGLGVISIPNAVLDDINSFLNKTNAFILFQNGNLYFFENHNLKKVTNLNLIKNTPVYKIENEKIVRLADDYLFNNKLLATYYSPQNGVTCSNNNNN